MRRGNYRDNFGSSSILFKIVPIFIGICFVVMICFYIITGAVVMKAAQDPTATAEGIGNFIKTIKESAGF